MIRFGILAVLVSLVASCAPVPVVPVPPPGEGAAPPPTVIPARRGRPQSAADFEAVVKRVEPVAERTCRELRPGLNCDFRVLVDNRPGVPPNAYQTYDRNGRPVIAITGGLLELMQNRDELAFVFSHEAAHHIAGHIEQTQLSGTAGVLIGGVLASVAGLDPAGVELAQSIGGTVGARQYSKAFELEADSLGARITERAGYDALVGVQYFMRARDPGDQFLGTHPPNAQRIDVVRRTVAGG